MVKKVPLGKMTKRQKSYVASKMTPAASKAKKKMRKGQAAKGRPGPTKRRAKLTGKRKK